MKIKSKFSYICSKCFRIDDVDMTFNFKSKDIYPSNFYAEMINSNHLETMYVCPSCKLQTSHFHVDRNIAKLVSILNKLGYSTDYSCGGHAIFYRNTEGNMDMSDYFGFPYISIQGCKKPTIELINSIVKCAFDDFTIGKRKTFDIIDINKAEDRERLMNTGTFSFSCWDSKIGDKYNDLSVEEANKKGQRYLNNLINHLCKELEKTFNMKGEK